MKGVKIRSSRSWYGPDFTPKPFQIPYIDNLGRYTGHTLYEWTCESRQAFATIYATISNRLINYCKRHNPWTIVKKHLRSIAMVSFVYSQNHSLHLWDRVLWMARNLTIRGRSLHKIGLHFFCKLSDNIRFVYGQVCSQTNWLFFRAERPRDKLLFEKRSLRLMKIRPKARSLFKVIAIDSAAHRAAKVL